MAEAGRSDSYKVEYIKRLLAGKYNEFGRSCASSKSISYYLVLNAADN